MKIIKDLGEKEVIWCKTLEECEKIAELLHRDGRRWNDGKSYLEHKLWADYKYSKFCFHVSDNTFIDYQCSLPEDYTIHHAKDFFPPQKYYTPQEVKVITNALIDDIIKEYHESKFQKNLLHILRERLK